MSSFDDAPDLLSTQTANEQGLISVQAPGKPKKEDKDKIKLTDLIDKTRATKEERDQDVDEVEANLVEGEEISREERGIYAQLALRHEDIGADNDQIFLVDGDSLLAELLADPLLDWAHGGQFLHVVYALEQYVHRLQEGGRIFRFVFFHCAASAAWSDSPLIQLLRERIIQHLQHQLNVPTNQFQNWWEAPFQAFLERVDPAFILVGDGAEPSRTEEEGESALTQYMSQLSLTTSTPSTLPVHEVVRSLTLYLLSHHFRVIRLTELTFANNSMYAFQMAMAREYKELLRTEGAIGKNPKLLEKVEVPADMKAAKLPQGVAPEENDFATAPSYRVAAHKSFDSALYTKLAANAALQSDARLRHTTYALSKLLSHPSAPKSAETAGLPLADLARGILVHTLLLRHLPLDARCLVWEDAEKNKDKVAVKYASLLNEFFQHMLAVATAANEDGEADLAASLDLFDGRLLSFLLHLVSGKAGEAVRTLGWSSSMEQQLLGAWSALQSAAPSASLPSFLPFHSITSISAAGVDDVDEKELVEAAYKKAEEKRAELEAAAGGAKSSTNATSPNPSTDSKPAASASIAEEEEDVPDSWDDVDVEEEEKPAAAKEEEEDAVESWEDISDEEPEEEKKEEQKQVEEEKTASDSGSASTPSKSNESAPLLPIASLTNKFVRDVAGDLDARLSAANLLFPAEPKLLSSFASPYQLSADKIIDDGMETEEKPKVALSRREQRAASRAVNYWEQYSKSLVGGRLVLREVVVAAKIEEGDEEEKDGAADDKKNGKNKKDAKAGKEKKGGGKPGAGGGKKGANKKGGEVLSMKDKIKAQVEEAKRAKEAQKIQGKINVASGIKTLEGRIAKLDSELEQMGDAQAIPALLVLLDWCMELWTQSKPKGDLQPAVKLFVLIHDIYRRFHQFLTDVEFKKVATALIKIGFDDAAHKMTAEFVSQSDKYTLAQVKLDIKSSSFPATLIGMPMNRFQLEYCGPWMLRNVDSAPDDRVSGFYPDKWQRDLLDAADANQSALIVAPTSAGKTFISYYVMKSILAFNKVQERTKDKGIVVYVAPNKALVNQVSADVYQRYGPVFGTATEDHQDKALTSEVLITVPSVLEKLLLNPQREAWASRIKWLIVDECHLISSASEGAIWERCLALTRCPFLALSATVGNPHGFHAWLARLQALRDRKVHLIVHETRWSDLEKSMYLPADPKVAPHNPDPHKFDMRTFSVAPNNRTEMRVHPCAAVGAADFADSTNFPKEVSFTPRDSLTLYDALLKHSATLNADLKAELSALSPESFFNELLISKARASEYEARLKQTLSRWLAAGLAKEVATVMQELSGDLRDRIRSMEGLSAAADNCYERSFIRKHFFSLLLEMKSREQLPAIVFSNDSELCVELVQDTLEKLEEMESVVLEAESQTEEAKLKVRARENALKALKKQRDKKIKSKQAEEEARDDADMMDTRDLEAEADAYEVDPRFSFIEETDRMDKKELDYWINRTLYKTQWKKSHPLIRALFRGIGVHHSGLVKQYRDLVETLFRGKHIKVVVSTATLALGVNMPTRTVVLAGDSKLLTPLQYRQMSGRAGRRGYDNIGNVVFFAIPPRKMFRLLKSPLNSLRGHFPVNTTLALKMMDYHAKVADKKVASDALLPLLKEPFFKDTWGGKHLQQQIAYHFRYSLDLLYEQSLLSPEGKAYGLATLATHMHASDDSNFGFAALLESGYIANMCKAYETDKNKVARELLTLLAHLFYRVPAPAYVTRANFRSSSPNLILLPKVDPEVKRIIQSHNQQTMERFTNYVRTFSRMELQKLPIKPEDEKKDSLNEDGSVAQKAHEGYYQLPTSGIHFPWTWSKSSVAPGSVVESVLKRAQPLDARSPFVALSGHGDSFKTARDLSESVRNGLFLDEKLLPVVMEDTDAHGQELQLNAYVVDFYRNQHFYSLVTDNRLTDAYAWSLLKNWSLLLSAITNTMRTLSADPLQDPVFKSFDHLSTTFEQMFSAIINI